ncbi:MAG: four helix bundle protein [Sediminibacterium sp.]|nr:four helix bundle protein [Sediminibacterium sp.]
MGKTGLWVLVFGLWSLVFGKTSLWENKSLLKTKDQHPKTAFPKDCFKTFVMRDFRKLEVWQQSLDYVKKIYQLTGTFPGNEKYGLVSQMNRSAISIPSNIAEGCSRKTSVEFSRFLEIAIGSAFELETQIEVCLLISYISKEQHSSLLSDLHILQRRVNMLKEKVK